MRTSLEDPVLVWDPFVRLFHWSLVVGFSVVYLTEDDLLTVHVWAGYVVGLLIVARIVWGVVGSRHARFSDFITIISQEKAPNPKAPRFKDVANTPTETKTLSAERQDARLSARTAFKAAGEIGGSHGQLLFSETVLW